MKLNRTGYLRAAAYLLAAAVTLSSVAYAGGLSGAADPTETDTASFNPLTGTLDIDYGSYLSKNDLVFNQPITDSRQGIMVGNGRVGAQVWNANGLTMQISGVDASENGFASQGQVNLYTTPAMDENQTGFEQRLSLYDGTMTTQYGNGSTVTVMGSPGTETLGIHVEDGRTDVESVTLDLSIWDVSNLVARAVGGAGTNITAWKTVSVFAEDNVIGLSRGQADTYNFGYTLAASVEGADFTTQIVNDSTVRLSIEPSSSYTIWISCASRLNAPEYNSVAQTKNELNEVKGTGYAPTLAAFRTWWNEFWSRSFVQYSNGSGTADYLESAYDLFMYTIAGGAYGNYPFQFINGVYSGMEDNDSDHWSHGYWYWNQRDVYNSFFASNHTDMMTVFNNLYTRNFDTLKAETASRFKFDGIFVPETMSWRGYASGLSDHTRTIYSTGTEVAENMYNIYRYSNDEAYLRNTAYPFMREAALFYVNMLSYDSVTGQYYMEESNSHETYFNVKNAITDLAAIRTLFPHTIEACELLGIEEDGALRMQLQEILDNLAPYALSADNQTYLPCDEPVPATQNNENVTNELVWPYGVTGIGYPDQQIAINSWYARPFPYGNVWAPDAIQAARLGLGSESYAGMIRMLQKYQNHPNGRTANTNGEFEYMGVHLSAMNESLLQSYDSIIRVFPAVPTDDDTFISRFTLLAKGGFLVSSEYADGDAKYVGVKSLYGNTATFSNPWGTEQVQVRKTSDDTIILTTSADRFSFDTGEDVVYVIERTAVPLDTFTYVQVTGVPNRGMKILAGTASTLGSPTAGRYEAEAAAMTGALTVAADSGASNLSVVTGFSANGSSLAFSGVMEGNRMSVGYVAASSTGRLGLYVNGVRVQTVVLPSADVTGGDYGVAELKINIPEGSAVKLQRDAGDTAATVDYIQVNGGAQPIPYQASRYEAESGTLTGTAQAAADTAASGGHQVTHLVSGGDSVAVSDVTAGTHLRIAYCTKNSTARMSLYVNGTDTGKNISFPSNGRAEGGYAIVTFVYKIPAGAVVKLQLDSGDVGVNIDYIEVATPLNIVRYEAEDATLYNAGTGSDSAASNGYQVRNLSANNTSSVTFENVSAGTQIEIRYCTNNTMGRMSLYASDRDSDSPTYGQLIDTGINVSFPTTNAWTLNYAIVYLNFSTVQGDSLRLQMDAGDSGVNLDYIQISNMSVPTADVDLSSVTQNTANAQVTVKNDEGIAERGVVYSADPNNGGCAVRRQLYRRPDRTCSGHRILLSELCDGFIRLYPVRTAANVHNGGRPRRKHHAGQNTALAG